VADVPIIEDGLSPCWRQALIDWAARNEAVTEMWVFGSRGPKATATADKDLDVGIVQVARWIELTATKQVFRQSDEKPQGISRSHQ
jgi:hypothetical protein